MNRTQLGRFFCVTVGLVMLAQLGVGSQTASGQEGFPCGDKQQCYDREWRKHRSGRFWYTTYYFRPEVQKDDFDYHYVVFYPGQNWVYYYNPRKKTYWCRALINQPRGAEGNPRNGGDVWIVLPTEGGVRKSQLRNIPPTQWARDPSVPTIPGSGETGPPMEAPPAPPEAT